MFDVKGKRAIITGGAQGFGKAFGIRLAGAGWTARREKKRKKKSRIVSAFRMIGDNLHLLSYKVHSSVSQMRDSLWSLT